MNRSTLTLLAAALAAAGVPSLTAAKVQVLPDETECAGPPSTMRLYVDVPNVREAAGRITATLYGDDKKRFLVKNGSLYVARFVAKRPVTKICLYIPAPGHYAVAVYHDANSNSRMDRKPIGIPEEGFGFSNNSSTLFGPPSFTAARFLVKGDGGRITIRMKYM